MKLLKKTSSRLAITRELAAVFKDSPPAEIDKVCYLAQGVLAPKFVGIELMLAEKMMIRSIAQVMNLSLDTVVAEFKDTGDLGETFVRLGAKKPECVHDKKLSVNDVYNKLVAIAKESGQGSQERKMSGMVLLLQSVDLASGKFLVRIPLQKLRLGFSDMTVLDGLSWMITGDKSLRFVLEHAYNVRADIGQVASVFKEKGIKGIETITPVPGTPIRPARATPLLDPKEILEKMSGTSALEPKFDGFRVQIHLDKNKTTKSESDELSLFAPSRPQTYVEIFSRNLDNITHMFPELVEAARRLPVDSVILDGEAVAVDPITGALLDFQETVKRKRKHDIDDMAAKIPLKAFIFDILYCNGQSLLQLPLVERRKQLEKVVTGKIEDKTPLALTRQEVVTDFEVFAKFFKEVSGEGLEGLMAKKINAPYRTGSRDFTWIKYKVAMQSELADTVDAIVMGYYKGEGKWAEFGLGRVLVGIPMDGKIVSLSKVGSGFSEAKLKEMLIRCKANEVKEKPQEYMVDKTLIPDVWVQPKILIEIRADSISRSPLYTTGLSLRFPRFIHFRDDKDVCEATTLEQVKGFAQK